MQKTARSRTRQDRRCRTHRDASAHVERSEDHEVQDANSSSEDSAGGEDRPLMVPNESPVRPQVTAHEALQQAIQLFLKILRKSDAAQGSDEAKAALSALPPEQLITTLEALGMAPALAALVPDALAHSSVRMAFYSNQLCERGTEVALFDYADYGERLLGLTVPLCHFAALLLCHTLARCIHARCTHARPCCALARRLMCCTHATRNTTLSRQSKNSAGKIGVAQ